MPASAGFSEANSRCLCPLPGTSAVGGDTREPTGISSAARRHAIRKELMHVAPAPMLDETNSSCSCPRMGSNAVGEDARKFDQIRSARKDGATCRGPYVGPLTITLWNCRSLWAQGTTETIRFMMQLTRAHGITVLTETRESKEILLFLESMLPDLGTALQQQNQSAERWCGNRCTVQISSTLLWQTQVESFHNR